MEHTGIYCNHLLVCLKKVKANVVIENPLIIKNSLGIIRGKYDKIDSIRIAQYAFKNKEELRLFIAKRQVILELANLLTVRNRLLSMQVALKSPLQEQALFMKKGIYAQSSKLCQNSLKGVSEDLLITETAIDLLINSDERLKHLMKIITSVPGVGRITAIQIIISTNEFLDINNPKKFACYAGVAPFVRESGIFKGKGRISSIANKKLKVMLHLCAISCLSGNNDLKSYYDRKTLVEGKPKMAVINALRNKIILRVFACVNQDRVFERNYINPIISTDQGLNESFIIK